MKGKQDRFLKGIAGIATGALLGAFASGCVTPGAKPGMKPPPAVEEGVEVPETGFGGRILLDNAISLPLSGTQVTTESETTVADRAGRFAFAKLSAGKHLVVAEKRFESGKVRRLLGVAKIFVDKAPVSIRIAMKDATDVDAYCLDCHPLMKHVTRPDQIMRDVHPSGILPKKAKKPTGKFDKTGRVTCESCHSIHRSTGSPHFTLVSYTDGKLCIQCH